MKKFSIPCDFNGVQSPFTIYIGNPEPKHHPLHFQADWLSRERGGTIPPNVMDSVAKLKDLSEKNNVSFEELCVYALGAAQQQEVEEEEDEDQEETEYDSETSEEEGGESDDEYSEATKEETNEIKDEVNNDKPASE
jgi:Ran GTPase-activating protein (RanGAP) involved in mRNA processing and transport